MRTATEGMPGCEQLVHAGVTFPGPGDQATLASAYVSQPVRLGPRGRAGRVSRRGAAGFRDSVLGWVFEAATVRNDRLLGASGQVVPLVDEDLHVMNHHHPPG